MKIQNILRIFLLFLGIYLAVDGLVFLSNVRLQSAYHLWPSSAFSYAYLTNAMAAAFMFLASYVAFIIQKDPKKYQNLISASALWAFFFGLLLIYLSSTQNLMSNFSNLPSLYVWMPFYNWYLVFEALLSFAYAGLVFIWLKGMKQ